MYFACFVTSLTRDKACFESLEIMARIFLEKVKTEKYHIIHFICQYNVRESTLCDYCNLNFNADKDKKIKIPRGRLLVLVVAKFGVFIPSVISI